MSCGDRAPAERRGPADEAQCAHFAQPHTSDRTHVRHRVKYHGATREGTQPLAPRRGSEQGAMGAEGSVARERCQGACWGRRPTGGDDRTRPGEDGLRMERIKAREEEESSPLIEPTSEPNYTGAAEIASERREGLPDFKRGAWLGQVEGRGWARWRGVAEWLTGGRQAVVQRPLGPALSDAGMKGPPAC
ncbi:unnamed protein product [Lota lota]